MDETKNNSKHFTTRREILKKALAGAAFAGAWSFGLREAIAQSRKTGKPLLNPATMTAMFSKNRASLREFGDDPKGFTLSHFSLTPAQEHAVLATTPEEAAAIRKGVETALRENLALVVEQTCRRVGGVPTQRERATGSEPEGTLLGAGSQKTMLGGESSSAGERKVVAEAARFQYVHEPSAKPTGFSGTLHMNASGFQP